MRKRKLMQTQKLKLTPMLQNAALAQVLPQIRAGMTERELASLLAVGTLLAGLRHYRYPGAGTNVVATLCFGWLLGSVTGPLVTGDNAALRMDYFKLLPVPARKLAYAMLGAAFADVSLAFSLVAFGALVGWLQSRA